MTKYEALVNAQSVYSWAVLFDHGSLFDMVEYGACIVLSVHFDWEKFDLGREEAFYRSLVLDDTTFKWYDQPKLEIDVLQITWSYSK